MFNINDWIYYRPKKGTKKIKAKVTGVEFDGTNYRYIIKTKDEKVIENVSIIHLSTW